MPTDIRVRFPVDDLTLSSLHARAFGRTPGTPSPWSQRLQQHALTWIGAFETDDLIGFVHLAWDGGSHAFVLDPVVDPRCQGQGVGTALVGAARREAARAGCEWLHVDFEPHLAGFYHRHCGFRPTQAGVLRLRSDGQDVEEPEE